MTAPVPAREQGATTSEAVEAVVAVLARHRLSDTWVPTVRREAAEAIVRAVAPVLRREWLAEVEPPLADTPEPRDPARTIPLGLRATAILPSPVRGLVVDVPPAGPPVRLTTLPATPAEVDDSGWTRAEIRKAPAGWLVIGPSVRVRPTEAEAREEATRGLDETAAYRAVHTITRDGTP